MKSSEKKIQIINAFDKIFEELESDFETDAKVMASKFLCEVKEICDLRNIKRKELAEMIGTSPSYLTQLYRGNKLMNLITLSKIKKALGLEVQIEITNNYYDFDVLDSSFEKFYEIIGSQNKVVNWGVYKLDDNNIHLQNDKECESVVKVNKKITA